MAPSLILTPNFDMEKTFFIRNQMEKIKNNKRKLEEMREELAGRMSSVELSGLNITFEHVVLDGEEEVVLVKGDGFEEGICVSMGDLHSGAVTLKQAVEALVGLSPDAIIVNVPADSVAAVQ